MTPMPLEPRVDANVKRWLKRMVRRARRRAERQNPESAGTRLKDFIWGWL